MRKNVKKENLEMIRDFFYFISIFCEIHWVFDDSIF